MSNLFNDTTRLRLNTRPSLSSVFSHEAPISRPKEPPPPPPPVEQVLLPVTPPRKFFPFFTSDELERINSVINGRGPEGPVSEVELEELDEFSSDEFSDDEFDSSSSATYENLCPKNVYDSVPDLLVEEDSLEEKLSFGPEYGETPPPEVVKIPELVEKAIEKTVIFTSQEEENKKESVSKAPTNPIMISSSSWINLQVYYFYPILRPIQCLTASVFALIFYKLWFFIRLYYGQFWPFRPILGPKIYPQVG